MQTLLLSFDKVKYFFWVFFKCSSLSPVLEWKMIWYHDIQWNSLKKLQPWKMFSFCYWKSGWTFKTLCACLDKLFWEEQLCDNKIWRFHFLWETKTRPTSIFVCSNKWLNGCFRMLPKLRLLAAPANVNRTIYQNVYLAPHFFSRSIFQMTNIWWKYLITFTFIVYFTTWVMNNLSHNKIQ